MYVYCDIGHGGSKLEDAFLKASFKYFPVDWD